MIKYIVDRKNEKLQFQKMLYEQINANIFAMLEDGQRGKSYLLWHFKDYCFEHQIPVALIDYDVNRSGISNFYQTAKSISDQFEMNGFNAVNTCYAKFFNEFSFINVNTGSGNGAVEISDGSSIENSSISKVSGRDLINIDLRGAQFNLDENTAYYRREKFQFELGNALMMDLAEFCKKNSRSVIIIDTLESISNETWSWISSWMFNHMDNKYPKLKVVLAGRREASKYLEVSSSWKDKMILLKNFEAFTREDIGNYFNLRSVTCTDAELDAYHKLVGKNPWLMSNIADILYEANKT